MGAVTALWAHGCLCAHQKPDTARTFCRGHSSGETEVINTTCHRHLIASFVFKGQTSSQLPIPVTTVFPSTALSHHPPRPHVGSRAPGEPAAERQTLLVPAGIVGLWSLAILAFERYVVVCRPLGDFRFQHRHAVSGCAFTWSWSLLWTTPPLMGWSSYVPEGRGDILHSPQSCLLGCCFQARGSWRVSGLEFKLTPPVCSVNHPLSGVALQKLPTAQHAAAVHTRDRQQRHELLRLLEHTNRHSAHPQPQPACAEAGQNTAHHTASPSCTASCQEPRLAVADLQDTGEGKARGVGAAALRGSTSACCAGACFRALLPPAIRTGLLWILLVPGLRTSCGPNWYTGGSSNNSYILSLFVTCFVMPLSLILFSYTNLLMTLRWVSTASTGKLMVFCSQNCWQGSSPS